MRAKRRADQQRINKRLLEIFHRETKICYRDMYDEDWCPEKQRKALGEANAPTSYRRYWRQMSRAYNKQLFIMCIDYDNLQQFPMNKVSCLYDWY